MFHRQIAFPVDVDRLWELVTDPSSVAAWFGSSVEWELTPGSEIRFADSEDGARAGRVESVDPPHQLRFQWWPEDRDAEVSEVTYHLAATEDGTQLTITEERLQDRRIPAMDPVVGSTATRAADGDDVSLINLAGSDESGRWTAWDTRLTGVWCLATAPAMIATA